MKQLVDKLVLFEREVSRDKGDFYLFALFLREDAQDKWDLMVSAPWIGTNKREALNYLAKDIQSRLTQTELLSLSRIVLIEIDNSALRAILNSIRAEHVAAELRNCNFSGVQIKHAYIITAKKPVQPQS